MEQLIALRKAMDEAEKIHQGYSQMNAFGLQAEDRVQRDIAYKKAEKDRFNTNLAYQTALNKFTE